MSRSAFLSCVLTLSFSFALAGGYQKVDDFWTTKEKSDGKVVVLRGRVDKFMAKTSKAGNPYTTFRLLGERKSVSVYAQVHLDPRPENGDIVEVNGTFTLEKKVGTQTFKDEIDVTPKKDKPFGVKIISGSNGK